MKQLSHLIIAASLIVLSSACVTTRDQMNSGRGSDRDTRSVRSENLPTATGQTTSVPMVVPGPVIQGPYAQPQVVATTTPTPFQGSLSEDELRAEVARLTGQVEELQHQKQLSDEELKKSQTRIVDLEKQVKELLPEVATVPEGMTPLDAGKDAMDSGKYDDAIAYFSQQLQVKDTGKDAEEATYLRGEAFFKKQQFNKAIVDFSHFPEKYQKSSFHPKALLRIAESFERMGRKDDARAFYSDLMDKFPRTAEGKVAKKRLKARL